MLAVETVFCIFCIQCVLKICLGQFSTPKRLFVAQIFEKFGLAKKNAVSLHRQNEAAKIYGLPSAENFPRQRAIFSK
jgi:hypothetical protein